MSKLYVVGIGPGKFEGMTHEAARVLGESDVIVGYTVYVDLVRDHFPDKAYLTTPMRREVERVELALQEAARGKTVAVVCSGDAGVYGFVAHDHTEIVSLILERLRALGRLIEQRDHFLSGFAEELLCELGALCAVLHALKGCYRVIEYIFLRSKASVGI